MATTRENDEFIKDIIATYPLDEAINWINQNLEPAEVFDDEVLRDWAEANGFIEDEG